jgi:hypothetical protein
MADCRAEYLKTFILGIGAQKAGTSWFRKSLNDLPNVNMGFQKEYHIWDHIFDHEVSKQETAEYAIRRLMATVPGVYESYFNSLINEEVNITGDITPAYSILNRNKYLDIKSKLESVGFNIKVVFLLRDPVDRNWSALRMNSRKDSTLTDQILLNSFHDFYREHSMVMRTTYNRTIEELEAVFSQDQIYVGFYENMFLVENLGKLSEFIGVDLTKSDTNKKVNSSKAVILPHDLRQECKNYFKEVYDYCYTRYPITKDIWR